MDDRRPARPLRLAVWLDRLLDPRLRAHRACAGFLALALHALIPGAAAAQPAEWKAEQVVFDDAETLQSKFDGGDLGGSGDLSCAAGTCVLAAPATDGLCIGEGLGQGGTCALYLDPAGLISFGMPGVAWQTRASLTTGDRWCWDEAQDSPGAEQLCLYVPDDLAANVDVDLTTIGAGGTEAGGIYGSDGTTPYASQTVTTAQTYLIPVGLHHEGFDVETSSVTWASSGICIGGSAVGTYCTVGDSSPCTGGGTCTEYGSAELAPGQYNVQVSGKVRGLGDGDAVGAVDCVALELFGIDSYAAYPPQGIVRAGPQVVRFGGLIDVASTDRLTVYTNTCSFGDGSTYDLTDVLFRLGSWSITATRVND